MGSEIEASQLTAAQQRELLKQLMAQESRAGGDEFPTSYAQKRLWVLDRLNPGNQIYNIAAAIRLTGSVDVRYIELALNKVIERHESLRTIFVEHDGIPYQRIQSGWKITTPVSDLTELPAAVRQDRIREVIAATNAIPFNLQSGPLFRVNLLKLAIDEYIAVFSMHHIVSDGWSLGILMRDFAAYYESLLSEQPPSLEPLEIQYVDYADWQLESQAEVDPTESLEYWRSQLQDSPLLELPTDGRQSQRRNARGGTLIRSLPATTWGAFKRLCGLQAATPFMGLLAVFQLLLARLSGQNDIVVGTPLAGRNRRELESLIGCFLNTLALRTRWDGNPTFIELLALARQAAVGGYAHQDVPFERLLEELPLPRNADRSPFFQVMLNHLNYQPPQLSLPGIQMQPLELPEVNAKFEITVYAEQQGNDLALRMVYDMDLYSESRAAVMLDQLIYLLEQVTEDPQRSINLYSLNSPASKRIIHSPDSWLDQPQFETVAETFRRVARLHPHACAVTHRGASLDYEQLLDRAERLASDIVNATQSDRDVVVVQGDKSIELAVAMLAVQLSGRVMLCIDPRLPDERQLQMEQSSAASLKISWGGDSLRENWKSDNFTLSICPRSGEVSGELHSRLAQADANYIFYTSGSTGKPKAILGSGQGLSHFLHWQRSRFEIGVGDRVAQLTALSFDVVLRDVFLPLTSGATLCMPNDSDAVLAPDILAWLDEEQITVLHTVPSLAQLWVGNYLLNQGTSLRWIFSAGEPLFDELCCKLQARFPSATIVNLYGPTETTLAKFYKVVGDIPHPGMQPVGSPLPQTQALVLQGECLCGVGEAGQVAIRTPFRSLGYLSPDASQADSFRANPCNNQSTDVIYLTGDRGRFAPNGELELLGRVDDQVKIRGVRIEPGEVAATILNYSRVRSCHVMPLVDQHGHKQLVAYLSCFQLNGEEPLDFDVGALIGYLSDRLPAPMVPSAYVVLDTLPLLPNGKVDRRALPAPNFDEPQIGAQKNVPPATPLQKELCAIWSEVLARDIQDITLNFFAIGGHSLLAAQVVSRLEHRCGVSLPLRTMFESPTIEKLAESIQLTASTGLVESLPPIVKRPDDRSAPLSLSQEALWFLDRLDPQSGAYTTYPTLRVRGHLDYDRLQQALDKVVDRHEVLRTTFPERDGQPVQVIASGPNSKVQLEDLQRFHTPRTRGADDGDFDPRIQAWLAAQSRHPIDLHTGPIVRLHLGRLAADDHLVVVAWHHIIHDGWSLGILAREILSTYESLSRNELPSLPALPIQYADWSVWQRELLSGKTHERLKNYWMGQLADVPSLELVTDFPRPKVRTTRGDSHRCELSPDLSRKINEFAQSSGVTPFMILLSAFGLVLARFSGQTDFAIGSPVANRRKMEVENLIGYFINMLALRVSINPETSFVDIVHHTRQVVLDAFEHQDLTLDHVVAAVNPPRDSSRHPLFQVMFVLHNNAPLSASGAGLTFEPVGNIPVRSSYFDLNLALTETEQGFAGQLVYNSDLFSPATIERMVETLSWLLESVLRDPRLPVKKFPAVLPHEEPKIRQFSLPTGNRITLASTQRCIHVEFKQRAVESPDQIALIDGTQSITYGELNRRAEDLAKTLISQSVQPGDLVAFQLSRSIEMIVTMLGILKAGAGYLPLDVKSPLGRNLDTLQDAAPRCIVTESLYADSFQSTGLAVLLTGHPSAELFVADNQAPSMLSAPRSVLNDNPRRSAVDAGNPAYVIYTSGSTGKPKGVVISHAAVMGYVLAAQQAYDITAADRLLQFTSISFDAHVEEVWVSLLSGATLVLRDDTMINSIAEFISASERYALTVWSLPTGFWHEVVNECDRSGLSLPGKLRIVVIGGETAIPDRLEAWHNLESPPRLLNSYGPTEATVVATVAELEWQESQSERLPIGRPLPNTMAYVLDEFRQLQPIGVRGELYLGGLSLADGYLHNAQLTTERFISLPMIRRDLLTGMDDRLYRTGDIVRWREDGQLEFFGRRDHQVKIRGFRVELSEIEGILRQHPLIDDALVVAEELRAGEIQLAAYLVGLTDELPTASVLRAYASQYLPEHMLPLQFQAISQIPRTVSGKVDRKSLPAIDWSGSSTPDNFVAPADEIELAIAVRFAEVLNREQVGVNDDFFALGGNSLLSLRLASRLREDFGLDVPLAVLFTSPTVRQLASRYRELPSSPPASEARSDRRDPECNASPIAVSDYLVELKAGNSGFPLFMIHGLGGHIVNFIPLARTLNTARPIWALQGLGIDGRFEPHADMGQMADLYCRALRQKQSHGPYRLLGWSMGGLLAMEIGRRLIEQGEAVEPLLLLDTHLSLKDRSLQAVTEESVLRQIAPRLGIPLRALRRLPIEAQWDTILRTSQELIRSPQGDNGEEEIRRLATVCKAHLQAMAENKLNYFPGQIILLQAARPWRRIDPRWRSLCDAFTSQTVAGSHYSMMAPPDVAQLAAAIDHALSAGSQ